MERNREVSTIQEQHVHIFGGETER